MDSIAILGAGLAGISTSFHLGHDRCRVFEKNWYPGGHIHTEILDGFTWDEGPHLSFTKYDYVRELFAANVDGDYLEYPVETGNYYQGHWIPHPAQSNLYAVPEPLRSRCLQDFLDVRAGNDAFVPQDYDQWLRFAFGDTFAETFPSAYTRKYWTVDPERLGTDWVGERVYFPSIEDVKQGAEGPLPEQTHYIKKIRYPARGGYFAYADRLTSNAKIDYNHELTRISFADRELFFSNGLRTPFDRLVLTLPLPIVVQRSDAPGHVQEAANALRCTSVLLVNVAVDHPTARPENWIYVYDEDKYSTRINCTEKLSPHNAPEGKSGIQVEVYFSKDKPMTESPEQIARHVCDELLEMGLIHGRDDIESVHTKWVEWANVVFDHGRREALDTIFGWLESHGLRRRDDDLEPTTDWNAALDRAEVDPTQTLFLAGRYAQWKYYWTDDCVMRGKVIGEEMA